MTSPNKGFRTNLNSDLTVRPTTILRMDYKVTNTAASKLCKGTSHNPFTTTHAIPKQRSRTVRWHRTNSMNTGARSDLRHQWNRLFTAQPIHNRTITSCVNFNTSKSRTRSTRTSWGMARCGRRQPPINPVNANGGRRRGMRRHPLATNTTVRTSLNLRSWGRQPSFVRRGTGGPTSTSQHQLAGHSNLTLPSM